MKELLLMAAVAAVLGIGYLLMGRLDGYLAENRRALEHRNEKREPACIVLTDNLPDEELAGEIRAFRSKHENVRVVLYAGDETEWFSAPGSAPEGKK